MKTLTSSSPLLLTSATTELCAHTDYARLELSEGLTTPIVREPHPKKPLMFRPSGFSSTALLVIKEQGMERVLKLFLGFRFIDKELAELLTTRQAVTA